MESKQYESLGACLRDFQTTFNDNQRVQKLTKNWERHIVVEGTDTGATHTMVVSGLRMTDVLDGEHAGGESPIHLQAHQETLIRIFSGDYNPAHALIEGELAVFSSERDKVKLEAITMVIWGI